MTGAPVTPGPSPFTIQLACGGRVVGDELAGRAPGYLFLHGLGSVRQGNKSDSLLRHAAASGRACVRIDMRGHGESSGTIGQLMVSELITDAVLVMQRMGRCVLVGSSLGGLVAAFASIAAPAHTAGLCLLAPALGLLANLDRRLDAEGRLQTSNGMAFPVLPHVLADARALDERTLPGRLQAPLLLVHGTADDVIAHGQSERFFAAIPHPRKELWIVPGGDHRLCEQAAEAWRRLDLLLAPKGDTGSRI